MDSLKDSVYRSLKVRELNEWIRLDIYGNLKPFADKKDVINSIEIFDRLGMKKHKRYLKWYLGNKIVV